MLKSTSSLAAIPLCDSLLSIGDELVSKPNIYVDLARCPDFGSFKWILQSKLKEL
eukprot:Awhi_evm2s11242